LSVDTRSDIRIGRSETENVSEFRDCQVQESAKTRSEDEESRLTKNAQINSVSCGNGFEESNEVLRIRVEIETGKGESSQTKALEERK